MIEVTIPQKNVVISFFQDDINIVKKHFMAISFEFDDSFKFHVFKEFIYSAAGMFQEIDINIYNKELIAAFKTIKFLDKNYINFLQKSRYAKNIYEKEFLTAQDDYNKENTKYEALKAEIQMLISSETSLYAQLKEQEKKLEHLKKKTRLSDNEKLHLSKLKKTRRDHVDAVHYLGERRKELESIQAELHEFESEHKAAFLEYFRSIKEKLDHQYEQSLSYFAFEFNQLLFVNSERSTEVKRFKRDANIHGALDLCKYLEYYLRNVEPDALSDEKKKENLKRAKLFCRNCKERANLF